jgi:hypothetical protein
MCSTPHHPLLPGYKKVTHVQPQLLLLPLAIGSPVSNIKMYYKKQKMLLIKNCGGVARTPNALKIFLTSLLRNLYNMKLFRCS